MQVSRPFRYVVLFLALIACDLSMGLVPQKTTKEDGQFRPSRICV